jgi:hypothetical protein
VVSGLKKVDPCLRDEVDKPVFLCDSPGPDAAAEVLERLRFPDALKRIAHDRLDKIKHSQGGLAVGMHPMTQVVAELSLKD